MKKTLLGLVFGLFLASTTNAGLHVEPYAGIQLGTSESESVEYPLGSGVAYGLRLGYGMLGAFVAADYSLYKAEMEADSGVSKGLKQDLSGKEMALTAGYDFPVIPIKVYGKYVFSAELEHDGGQLQYPIGTNELAKGSGIGLGVGLTMLPFVDINFEYRTIAYDELEGPGNPTLSEDIDVTFYMISASIPLDLP